MMNSVLHRLMQNSVEGQELPGLGKCRLCTYAPTAKGTVMMRIGQKFVTAARASWEAHKGPITDPTLLVCHKCDNPACINVEHMFLGTHKANMADMRAKGRSNCKANNPTGKNVKLDPSLYPAIVQDPRTQREVAAAYNVSTRTIRNIINTRV